MSGFSVEKRSFKKACFLRLALPLCALSEQCERALRIMAVIAVGASGLYLCVK
jgi:hypothetical protein